MAQNREKMTATVSLIRRVLFWPKIRKCVGRSPTLVLAALCSGDFFPLGKICLRALRFPQLLAVIIVRKLFLFGKWFFPQ